MTALSASQVRAVSLIASGERYGAVAAAVGVDVATVYRWRRLPEVRAALEAELDGLREELRDGLVAAGRVALEALVHVASDLDSPASARVAAGRELLSRLAPARLDVDHEVSGVPWLADLRAVLEAAPDEVIDALAGEPSEPERWLLE